MDDRRNRRVWVCRLPVWVLGTILLTAFWIPAYDAFHYGQVTPVITGILAIGLGKKPFYKGLAVGLAAAIKPTFILLAPFIAIAYGWTALLGSALGVLPAVVYVPWFIEYLHTIPRFSGRYFAHNSIIHFLGYPGSIFLTCVLCLFVSLRAKNEETAYPALIGIATVGTALWWHSYCPLIITILFFANRLIRRQEEIIDAAVLDSADNVSPEN